MKKILQKMFNNLKNLPMQTGLFIVICLIGAGLRFYRLSYFDLWYDEVASIRETTDIARLISGLPLITVAPLYFSLLFLWVKIFGISIYSVRVFSVIPSALSIILLYLLAKKFYDQKTGLLSALILALAPLHIWYAQEARMYSISICVCLLMVYTSMQLQKQQNLRWLIAFLCAGISAVYINYFALFILGACLGLQQSKILFAKRNQTGLVTLILFILPCIFMAWQQMQNVRYSFWISTPRITDLNIACANFITGYNGTLLTISAAVVLLFGLIVIALLKEPKDNKYWLIVGCGIIPIIFIFIFSQFVPVFVVKTLIIFTPFIYLMIIRGILNISWRPAKLLVLAMLLGIIVFSLNNYYKGIMPEAERFSAGVQPKVQIKSAVSLIKSQLQPGDIIAHSNAHTLFPFLYAMQSEKNIRQIYLHIPEAQQDEYWKKMYVKGKKLSRPALKEFSYKVMQLGSSQVLYAQRRMWLISSNWRIDGLMDNHALAVRKQAMLRFKKAQTIYINNMYIDLFLMDKPAQEIVDRVK